MSYWESGKVWGYRLHYLKIYWLSLLDPNIYESCHVEDEVRENNFSQKKIKKVGEHNKTPTFSGFG